MDTSQWPQQENIGLIVKPMEEMVSNVNACSSNNNNNNNNLDQRKTGAIRPPKEQALNCPRCNSTNTKFCYYNNYSLTQPRYFCKTCRRYWTEGGSLRNVPVGGGSRKNRRSSSSSTSTSTSTSSSSKILSSSSHQNPKIHEGQDLNLAFHHTISEFVHELPNIGNSTNFSTSTTTTTTASAATSLSEMLRNGISNSSRGSSLMMNGASSNNFMPTTADHSTTVNYSTGFGLQDFKPNTLNFGLDGLGSVGGIYGGVHHHHQHQHQESSNGMRPLFPFEDLRQVSNTTTTTTPTTTNDHTHDHQFHHEQNRTGQGDSNGYWSGMLGGGSW